MESLSLKSLYRSARWRWHNLFADQGVFRKHWRFYLSRFNLELNHALRQGIAKDIAKQTDEHLKQVAFSLRQNGYALLKFSDIGVDPTATLETMNEFMNTHTTLLQDESYLSQFHAGIYGGKAMSYSVYEKTEPTSSSPIMDLACHANIIRIASLYLGYYPFLDCISLLYTPAHDSPQFGAQRWHVDTYNKNILKIFYSSYPISKEHGPFEFFEPKYSTLKYHQFYPESMNDEELKNAGLDPKNAKTFLAQPGEVLFVDTARCLHRGGCTEIPRFISTAAYCSPFYNFAKTQFRDTLHYKQAFQYHREDSENILRKLALMPTDLFA